MQPDITAFWDAIWTLVMGKAGRLSPLFLFTFVLIIFALWIAKGRKSSFWAWAFPKSVYFHGSHWVDIKIFLFSRLFVIAGLVSRFSLTAIISASVAAWINAGAPNTSTWPTLAVAALILIVIDFCTYWIHRIHHQTPVLWPFHAVHHSAEVLTPITVFRKHPIYDLISELVRGALLGMVLGVVLGLFVGAVPAYAVFNVNIFYFAFNLVGSNIRHSHIWLSYGRRLEHILISPAQHQIHHSLAAQHHNKNYGEVLAIWDWMFGTLYIPEREEFLEFGLADASGARIEQPHPSLWRSLWVPFRDAWRAARPTQRKG